MKKIKFRGKRPNGSYNHGRNIRFKSNGSVLILGADVIPETVGQFVGLYDKNGKEVYEHDYISINYKYEQHTINGAIPDQDCLCYGEVVFMDEFSCFGIRLYDAEYPIKQSLNECPYMTVPLLQFDLECDCIEVLGNIFDNPELLKGDHDGQTAE